MKKVEIPKRRLFICSCYSICPIIRTPNDCARHFKYLYASSGDPKFSSRRHLPCAGQNEFSQLVHKIETSLPDSNGFLR